MGTKTTGHSRRSLSHHPPRVGPFTRSVARRHFGTPPCLATPVFSKLAARRRFITIAGGCQTGFFHPKLRSRSFGEDGSQNLRAAEVITASRARGLKTFGLELCVHLSPRYYLLTLVLPRETEVS
eukprot:scaffold79101_cov65-Phaeocystis_antarctica.AAC.2